MDDSDPRGPDDDIAGDGSGDPNDDRAFLQDLPPAQVDDEAVREELDDDA